MSVSRQRIKVGSMEAGYNMSDPGIWTHITGFCVMAMSMLYSYAALIEAGPLTAIVGFSFAFGFLLLIYGHHFDAFYLHIGDKLKIGGDAYDPIRKRDKENAKELLEEERE